MKKSIIITVAIAVTMLVSTTAFAATEIKFAHVGSLEHQYNVGAEAFKKLVEERSNGSIKVTIFPQSQLGNERDAIEGIRMGTINMTTVAAAGALASFVPEMSVIAIPYVLETRQQAYKVLDGPFGKKLNGLIEKKGFKNLAFWEIGFRNFTNSVRPIKSPADMKGLKIRVQESKSWMEMIKKLGAVPTPVSFGELYSALQQKVVDGQENPTASIYSMKFYEVQKYMTLDGHTYEASVVIVNPKWFNSLPEADQRLITKAAIDAGNIQRDTLAKLDTTRLAEMKKAGVNIEENPDRKAFREATKDIAALLEREGIPKELINGFADAAGKAK
ncbi:MAG: DctP family TRAP transporter solute-binding subunit [Synergistaceae bacterium]|nr:DctP family TRAP transporter solute-binding subunit [Synergistaceae bacterium]